MGFPWANAALIDGSSIVCMPDTMTITTMPVHEESTLCMLLLYMHLSLPTHISKGWVVWALDGLTHLERIRAKEEENGRQQE